MTNQNVKIVYVDEYHSHPVAISLSAYRQIQQIAEANHICQDCAAPYTDSNPMVVRNTCLRCFMQSEIVRREKHLSFVGKFGQDTSGDIQYKFLDADGYAYFTDSVSDQTTGLVAHISATLAHWGFQLPESLTRNNRTIVLDDHSWHVYGNFRENPVIVCRYKENYGSHLEAVFFVYKDRVAVEINKRLKPIQKLFQQARAQVEATKDAEGKYHLADGSTTYQLEEISLYPTIADLRSQQVLLLRSEQLPLLQEE